MQLMYLGAHPAVVVDEFDPNTVIVRGESVDIPDPLAARLLEQDTWTVAEKSVTPSTVTANAAATVASVVAPQAVTVAPTASQAASTPVDADTTTKGSN